MIFSNSKFYYTIIIFIIIVDVVVDVAFVN